MYDLIGERGSSSAVARHPTNPVLTVDAGDLIRLCLKSPPVERGLAGERAGHA